MKVTVEEKKALAEWMKYELHYKVKVLLKDGSRDDMTALEDGIPYLAYTDIEWEPDTNPRQLAEVLVKLEELKLLWKITHDPKVKWEPSWIQDPDNATTILRAVIEVLKENNEIEVG